MRQYLGRLIIYGVILIASSGLVFANDQLDKEALETLIKGNTIEGTKIKWKSTYKTYFDETGKFKRIDSKNNEEGGAWKVEGNGMLVMTGRKEKKRIVKQREDGGYDVYNQRGQVIWTIDKVTSGNPYNLVPPDAPFMQFQR
jgi:hypothetical protein